MKKNIKKHQNVKTMKWQSLLMFLIIYSLLGKLCFPFFYIQIVFEGL